MKTFFIFLMTVGVTSVVQANTLTYRADFTQMPEKDATSLDICGYPETFKMDAADPLAKTFIDTLLSGNVSKEEIQATSSSLGGGSLSEAYSGAYREKVYIVKQGGGGAYNPWIVYRVQVNTYGSTTAPSGFVVNSELLNHRYSAELAEGAFCGDVYYLLVK